MHIREEVFACTRAFEHLLASGIALTEDERSFFHHYFHEVAQYFDLSLEADPTLF